MPRKTGKELEEIKKKFGVDTLWSWSRYNTYKTDQYSYLLKYIMKIPEDKQDSIYGVSGGIAHEIIEKFYSDKNFTHEQMLSQYEDELFNFNMAELKYNRNDDEKNEKISSKYEACLKHFFLNHNRIPYKPKIETFITVKVGKYLFQGYIDFMFIEEIDGKKILRIVDWKTSTIYKGEKVNKEKGQLVLYAEAIMQMLKVPLDNIKIQWNFLKYVDADYTQAKGDVKTRTIERNEIGSKLASNVSMWLKKLKYDELEIEDLVQRMVEENSIDCLPKEIQEKFYIRDCYVDIPLTQEEISNLKEDIIKTLDEINEKTDKFSKTKDDKLFWEDVTKERSYFLSTLSGYSRKHHKPYDEYLKDLEMFNKDKEENIEDDDLDWMNDL